MKLRRLSDKKPKVVLFQGSSRNRETCPNMIPKTHKIIEYILDNYNLFIDFTVIDLSVNQNIKPIIQPCKGCVSTAGGYHCHFPCSCYKKNDNIMPDLLSDLNVFNLLKESDAFIIFSPIYLHSLTSQVKALFDRLVCINQSLTKDDAVKLMGNNIKNSKITGKFAQTKEYNHLFKNHLENKIAGFYVHGDNGANDYENTNLPKSYDNVYEVYSHNPELVLEPYILQLKYSGVYVPDDLIEAFYTNEGIDYYTANKKFISTNIFFERADELITNLLNHF